MAHDEPYTLEQAEDDITQLRGQVDRLSEVLPGGLIWIAGGQLAATDPVNGGAETWHSLGSSGLAGEAGYAKFRLTIQNELQISVHLTFNALGAFADANFATAVPAAYLTTMSANSGGNAIGTAPSGTAQAGTRISVNNSSGVVTLLRLPAGATAAGCDVKIPLDA